ncbi:MULTISPECIES: cytochrome P450 [unclassified Ensifer]|uniref:cytochrome P450 n=1 Tax=unclassified Ensifer TaxID=2633371 RepID=UPI0013747A7C|nr:MULTISPECIES: cytochrome P450 [unclassified Ensifer]
MGKLFDMVDFMYLSGWQKFFERRLQRYGSTVFTTPLFTKTVVATDHKAISALFDTIPFIQDYGFGSAVPPKPLVGDVAPSVFETGVLHDNPKAFYFSLLRHRATSLPAVFEEVLREYEVRWASRGRFAWRDEIETFTMDFVLRWILELKFDTAKVRLIYNNIFTNHLWRVARFFPWTRYSRSLRYYGEFVRAIEEASSFEAIMEIARTFGISDRAYVAKQIAFLTGMNSYLGLQNLFKSIVGELSSRADIRSDLDLQLRDAAPGALFSPRVRAVDEFVMEVLRQHPPVFFIFGRAIEDVVLESASGSFDIAKGERLMGVIPFAHDDPEAFPDPASFQPERFQDDEARAKLIWPRGIQERPADTADRTCPGKDVALLLAHAFCTALVTRYQWTVVKPITWDKHRYSLNVAAPMGELEVAGFTIRDERAGRPV